MLFDHKKCAYALIRISLGLIFLVSGIEKIMIGPSVFANNLVGQFGQTALPAQLVRLFGTALPFVEVAIGLLVTLGLFTMVGLSLAALLLMALTFGMVLLGQHQTVGHNLLFSLTTFFLLFHLEFNAYAIDPFLRRRQTLLVREGNRRVVPDVPVTSRSRS